MAVSSSPAAGSTPTTESESSTASHDADRLTRWALLMVPGTALSSLLAFSVGTALMHATGTPEGQLLTSAGGAGWVSWIIVLLVMISAPSVGLALALAARRAGGSARTNLALYVNAVLIVGIVASAVANLFA